MTNYETIFICRADLPEEKIQELVEKVKSIIVQSKGEVISVDNWGKKKLAYKIAHQREGKYIYINFAAAGDIVEKIERFYRVTEGIIRFLTIKKSGKNIQNKVTSE
ncbi:MAG: 30S ribosomal protein S6 [Elusimicrobiota bacterium]|nr:30S ribosomal protein S6 [Elusimicrobiota bacterium]